MGKIIKHSVLDNIPFWILAGMSIIIGTIAFFIPPKAEVHPSVLHLISWFFAFAALWTVYVSIKHGLDARIQHGKTSLTVGSLEGGGQQQYDADPDDTDPDDPNAAPNPSPS